MAELVEEDYVEIALSLLIERFKDNEAMQKLVTIVAKTGMDIQTSIFQIRERFVLPTAAGQELTIIGKVWDESRQQDSDTVLRGRINAKISLSISGTISEIKTIILSVYGGTFVEYSPFYPAGFTIVTDGTIPAGTLTLISAAGVLGLLGFYLIDSAGNYIVDSAGNNIISI